MLKEIVLLADILHLAIVKTLGFSRLCLGLDYGHNDLQTYDQILTTHAQ